MKSKTTISYVILKYDDQTDNIYTKTTNNESHVYEIPTSDYVQKRDSTFEDIKDYVKEKMLDFDTPIDEKHIFIPFINVFSENNTQIYNYVVVILESTKDSFASMNFESWYRIKFDQAKQIWNLTWDSGLTNPIDFEFKNSAVADYAVNVKNNPEINFSNVMYFVSEQTKDFPILGLMSGDKFTMKQVFHYQDLLGIEALKAGDNATFENQYADSIQAVEDNRITTSYKIKNEYLKK